MPMIGTVTVSTSAGGAVSFGASATSSGTSNLEFRARTIALNNLGSNGVFLDIHTTSGNSTGWTLAAGASQVFTELAGSRGFSTVLSTTSSGSSTTLSYMASR